MSINKFSHKNKKEKTSFPSHPSNGYSLGQFLFPAVLVVFGFIIYSNSFECSFHFDDRPNILDNKVIRNFNLGEIWNFSHNRFLPFVSFAVNYHFGAYEVWGYHFVNILIHVAASCVVYWLTLLLFATPVLKQHALSGQSRWVALATALLFVAHPLATQSVTYIVQRMASMVALFYFLSIAFYIKGRLADTRFKKITFLLAAVLAGLSAVHTKENAYTLPVCILLTELALFQVQPLKINNKRLWIFFGILSVSVVLAIARFSTAVFKPIPPSFGNAYTISASEYLFTQFSVILKYIQLLFLPINQNLDYDYPIATGFFEVRTAVSFLLLTSLLVWALYIYNKNRLFSFTVLWFFITLSIESSFVPISDVIFEHRTYLPSFGFFLLLVVTIFNFSNKRQLQMALPFCLLLAGMYGIATYQRNKIWLNDFSLWSDVIEKSPEKARPLVSRADIYREQGAWNLAVTDYEAALALNPNYAMAVNNLGLVYKNLGQWDKAIINYSRSIELDSTDINGFINRGIAFGFVQKFDSALIDLNHAVNMKQKINVAYNNRGIVHSMMGKYREAIADFDTAISLSPRYSTAFKNRGCVFLSINELNPALDNLSTAISISPDFGEAYFYRGVVYGLMQDWKNAIKDYDQTLVLDPNNSNARTNRELAIKQLAGQNVISK